MALRRKKRREEKERRQAEQQTELQRTQSAPDNRILWTQDERNQLEHMQNGSELPQNGTTTEQTTQMSSDDNAPTQGIVGSATTESKAVLNPVITERTVLQAYDRLMRYKTYKTSLDRRIKANEDYWKLRQWDYYDHNGNKKKGDNEVATAWLWNCIASKHADLMDGYPESNIRPKREDDVEEAEKLKSILPVIFEENDYENTYSELANYILKQGVCCAGVFWDGTKHDGLGDISVEKIDILNLFWESGVTDIQDSKEVFHTSLVDNESLVKQYPQLEGKLNSHKVISDQYRTDDAIDTDGKTTVVDWFYKQSDSNGNQVLHYCKFVEGTVLFATENDAENYPNGWYDHGLYPFVVTPLFPVEGSIAGYGYTDIGRGDQHAIDVLTQAMLTNARVTSKPRYFSKTNGAVNEAEFADWSKDFVHVTGSLNDDSIKLIATSPVPTFVVNMRENLIAEMKETLGNRDVNNGGSTSGVTAASAIATMQEQSGKMSRTHNKIMYTMHRKITNMVIELIRQFYDVLREYRITGKYGQEKFVQYNNAGLKPQKQPSVLGRDMGLRLPCFDIEVTAQKASPYTKMEQNELAIQLYNLGVFSPQNVDMSLMLLQTMDFAHKDEIIQMIMQNGTMFDKYQQLQKIAFNLAQQVDMQNGTQMAEQLAQAILVENGNNSKEPSGNLSVDGITEDDTSERSFMTNAREKAQASTQVNQ